MKQTEREFLITAEHPGKRPRVLLLGNGVCRSFGGISWNGLIDHLKDEKKYPLAAERYVMPMPLKAALLTDNTLATKMKEIVKAVEKPDPDQDAYNWNSFIKVTPEMKQQLRRLIGEKGEQFDYILTTNYSYEIEAALTDSDDPVGADSKKLLTDQQISRMMSFHEVDHAQAKFLVNTFNEVPITGKGTSARNAPKVPVWHIHGEARKPGSMIIGNYYYGKILRRCVERLDEFPGVEEEGQKKRGSTRTNLFRTAMNQGKPIKIGSWIDAFVLGDVYILGFGLDFSESDIWWLLEYKANHKDICGATYYYEPRKDSADVCINDVSIPCGSRKRFVDGSQCRDLLLKTYGVQLKDLDFEIKTREDYPRFFQQAIDEIVKA